MKHVSLSLVILFSLCFSVEAKERKRDWSFFGLFSKPTQTAVQNPTIAPAPAPVQVPETTVVPSAPVCNLDGTCTAGCPSSVTATESGTSPNRAPLKNSLGITKKVLGKAKQAVVKTKEVGRKIIADRPKLLKRNRCWC